MTALIRRASLVLFFVLLTSAASATEASEVGANEEFVPVAARGTGEICANPNDKEGAPKAFALESMFDGRLDTFAAIQDESRDGTNPTLDPPYGSLPLTTSFTLDMGRAVRAEGIRFVSRAYWTTASVRVVSVFACDDPDGKTNLRPAVESLELLPTNNGFSVCATWAPLESRYWLVRVENAYALRETNRGAWPLPRRENGSTPPADHLNVQIAEIRLLSNKDQAIGSVAPSPDDSAFPRERLEADWLNQDCGPDVGACFASTENADVERKTVEKVLAELPDEARAAFRERLERLVADAVVGARPEWKALYFDACAARRRERLAGLLEETNRIVFVKHCVFGGGAGLTGMPQVSDEQYLDMPSEIRGGSQLCLLTLNEDGSARREVLLNRPNGIIRDVSLSYDAKTVLFAMRDSFDDDYRLFTLALEDRALRRLTFAPEPDAQGRRFGCADFEPCFAPDGSVLFASTRGVQINDCWPNANTNIFRCDADGGNIRRLTFDELDVNYPQIMNDGRVLFTRWEYSDRNAFFLHPLMTMNPDGTSQTEFCGNNSTYPASYIQARAIPGSSKVVAIISGHHTCHKGKLALVDRSLGAQDGRGIEYVAGSSPDGTPGRKKSTIQAQGFFDASIDFFGQDGPQFRYPYALDEDRYLVAICPEGWANGLLGPFLPPFGLYYATADGERELLAFDWAISAGSSAPATERDVPTAKPSRVDPRANVGTFVVQDVYVGPGLEGIPRGVVKKLRVVALEYRAGRVGKGSNGGEVATGLVQTPISFNNGAWDVKHPLGEVDVEEDGSCKFEVPARTPVYFQLLDEKGYCVQTMRSWSTLQGGETFACLGCHEEKLDAGEMAPGRLASIAASKPAQKLQPVGGRASRLVERLERESCLDSIENYWGVNAPIADVAPDRPADGFSYRREVQPILDRCCVACHTGDAGNPDPRKASALSLTGDPVSVENLKTNGDDEHRRFYSRSYLELTKNGFAKDNPYVRWIETRSRSEMLPPYFTGSSKSPLMKYLEPEHYGVDVSENEKRTIACWIDLLIPFCGSYPEANRWSDEEKRDYLRCVEKRRFFATQELNDVRRSLGLPPL